jgi:hypothetical protein
MPDGAAITKVRIVISGTEAPGYYAMAFFAFKDIFFSAFTAMARNVKIHFFYS